MRCPAIVRKSLQALRMHAVAFVSDEASPLPLAVLRIGLSAVLIAQAVAIGADIQELYGSHGVIQWSITDPTRGLSALEPGVPRIRWIAELLGPMGVSEAAAVRGVFVAYVTALGALLIGLRTRISAVAVWLLHLALNVSGTATIYGVDMFANIALFYMVWMPVGNALSVDVASGRLSGTPTALARLSLRVLQLHMCIVYVMSGIDKAGGEQWWNGEAIWRAVTLPGLSQFDMTFLARHPWIPLVAGWGTLLLEAGYPLFVWPGPLRKIGTLGMIALHAGIGVTMGLVSFSAIMITLNLSAFIISAEPKAEALARDRFRRAVARFRRRGAVAA